MTAFVPLLARLVPAALDAFFACTIALAGGWMVTRLARAPIVRQRAAEAALALCVVILLTALLPDRPQFSLALFPATSATWHTGPSITDNDLPNDGPGNAPARAPVSPQTPAQRAARTVAVLGRDIADALPLILAAGVVIAGLLALLRTLAGWLLLRRLVHTSAPPTPLTAARWRRVAAPAFWPALRRSPMTPRPIAFGIARPHVLIPHWLDQPDHHAACAAVLAHEAAHLRHRDAIGLLLATVLQPVLALHPLYWSLRRSLRLAQDQIADAHAADIVGSPTAYAEHLISLLRHLPHHEPAFARLPALNALTRTAEFRDRITRLASPHWRTADRLSRRAAIGLTLASALAAMLCLCVTLRANVPAHHAADATPAAGPFAPADSTARPTPLSRGLAYLRSHQTPSGAWFPDAGPSVTALVVKALLQAGAAPDDPAITRALHFIASTRHANGGYYRNDDPTYNTAIVLSTLTLFPRHRFQSEIAAGHAFLQARQPKPLSTWYTASPAPLFTPSPLVAPSGNWKLETGNLPKYSSQPERSATDILPSYGRITYAQFKSLLYAPLSANDPRTRATLRWIRSTYTLADNPADDSHRGEFYYYHAFAKALRAADISTITDSHGIPHNWRAELQSHLAALQSRDGSWINRSATDYMENNPILVTAYSVLALEETSQPVAQVAN